MKLTVQRTRSRSGKLELGDDVRYSIRAMREEDVAQIIEIDREAFPTQWPYPAYAYKRELNNRLAWYIVVTEEGVEWKRYRSNHSGSLLQPLLRLFRPSSSKALPSTEPVAPCIAGFAGVWRMLDEAHLTTVAVRGNWRRKGFGELLLVNAIEMALQHRASVVTLEVRLSNTAAQALYRKYGFKDAGIRKGYYSEDGEDALIMTTDPITSESYQAKFLELKERLLQRMASLDAQAATPVAAN